MSASHFTVYLLQTKLDWKQIIDEFNEDKDIDKQYILRTNNDGIIFNNISNYRLYTRAAETTPDWGLTLENLVINLDNVTNISHSYVLFLQVGKQNFAATGGNGYQAIENHKDFSFGIDLLSRLIDRNDSVIKRTNDRYISGNIMGGVYQFNGSVSINTEKEFNNYFNEIYLALSTEKIEEKLGIKINTKKKDYRLLAKDSIKLGKSLTISELDTLLGSLINLLGQEGYSINPFYRLKEKDPKIEQLNAKLVNDFRDYLNSDVTITDFNIVPFYQVFDSHYIAINNEKSIKKDYENEQDIIDYFTEQVSLDLNNDVLFTVINNTILSGEIDGIEEVQKKLYEHLDVKLRLGNDTYWLMNGNWYYLKREFIKEININFINKITNDYDLDFKLDSINFWPDNEKEGDYNYKHNCNESTYVLDKIFYNNIEVCDLLVEEENKVYFVHVKNGLDGEIRILVDQIISAMHMVSNGKMHDTNILEGYYQSILNKIKSEDPKKESQISISAKKFKARFPEKETFIDVIGRKEIVFVFAYKPLDSHDLNNPNTIKSTAAKIAMINLAEMKKDFDFTLKFLNIKQKSSEMSQLKTSTTTTE